MDLNLIEFIQYDKDYMPYYNVYVIVSTGGKNHGTGENFCQQEQMMNFGKKFSPDKNIWLYGDF